MTPTTCTGNCWSRYHQGQGQLTCHPDGEALVFVNNHDETEQVVVCLGCGVSRRYRGVRAAFK